MAMRMWVNQKSREDKILTAGAQDQMTDRWPATPKARMVCSCVSQSQHQDCKGRTDGPEWNQRAERKDWSQREGRRLRGMAAPGRDERAKMGQSLGRAGLEPRKARPRIKA